MLPELRIGNVNMHYHVLNQYPWDVPCLLIHRQLEVRRNEWRVGLIEQGK